MAQPHIAGDPPWSHTVQVAEVPQTGRHVELHADAPTREAVAKAVGVLALPRLEASFDVAPVARDGLRVSGSVSATVEQTCVVTLEPMTSQIEEPFELIFMPEGTIVPPDTPLLSPTDDDPPEALKNGKVDLGALAIEFLVLAIDPYPRKPGAAFASPGADKGPDAQPFAALAALKAKTDKKPG